MKIIAVIVCLLAAILNGQAQVSVSWRPISPMMMGVARATAVIDSSTFIVVGADSAAVRTSDRGVTWTTCRFPSGTHWFDVVSLASGVVVAVGNRGNIARSNDAGLSWRFEKISLDVDLYHIWTDYDQTIVATGDSGRIVRSIDAGRLWEPVESHVTGAIPALTMSPSGRLLGYDTTGAIIYSDDKGTTWSTAIRDTSWRITGMTMISTDTGLAVGMFKGVSTTSDGGATWKTVELQPDSAVKMYAPPTRFARSLLYSNADRTATVITIWGESVVSDTTFTRWQKGLIQGSNRRTQVHDLEVDRRGHLWVTTDNELMSVTSLDNVPVFNGFLLPFTHRQGCKSLLTREGIVASYSYQKYDDFWITRPVLQVSEDLGLSVQLRPVEGPNVNPLVSVSELSAIGKDSWLIVGYEEDRLHNRGYQRLYRTSDAGNTWSAVRMTRYIERMYSSHASLSGHFSFYDGSTFSTVNQVNSDTLQTHERQLPYTDEQVFGCHSVDADLFFAFGSAGTLFRTNDTAGMMEKQRIPNAEKVQHMSFADRDYGICVDNRGSVFRTINAGLTWEMVKSLDTKGLFRVNVLDRLTWLVASGNGNILFTTDGGTSWLDVSIPGSMLPWTIDNCIVINTSEFLVSSNEYVYLGKLSGTTSNLDDSTSSRHSVTPTLLSIAPNPSMNSATITVADRSPVLRLYDASGRLVASYTVENGRVVVNTSELSNGVYNVVSDTGSGVLVVNR